MEEIFVVPAFPELKLGFGDSPERGGRGLISAQNFLLTNWMLIAIITPLGAFLFGMGRSTDEEFARFAQGSAGGDLGVESRAPKWLTGGGNTMKTILKTILKAMLAVIAVIALSAANNLAALKMAEQTLARYRNVLLAFTIPVAALGFTLFMAGILLMVYEKGTPMSHTEVEEQHPITQNMGAPYVARWSAYRIFGKAEGRQFSEELPIRDYKLAWQSGAWRRDKIWRARFTVFGGALMAIFGGMAAVAVVSPIVFSLVCAALLIYSAVRLIWALWHA